MRASETIRDRARTRFSAVGFAEVSRTALVATVLLLATVAPASAQQVKPCIDLYKQDGGIGSAQVELTLACVQNERADRAFEENDLSEARSLYGAALESISAIKTDDKDLAATTAFLRTEINYRLELLIAGYDFWGSDFSTSVFNPVAQVTYFDTDVTNLDAAVSKFEIDQASLGQLTLQQLQAAQQQDHASLEENVQQLTKVRGDIQEHYAERRENNLRDRIDQLHAEERKLIAQQSSLLAQITQGENAMNALLEQGVGGALGLPPDTLNAVESGHLDAGLKQAAISLAGDPGFASDLEESSDVIATIGETYRQADAIVAKVNSTKEGLEQVRDLVQKPTLDNLAAVGSKLLSKADPQTQAAIRDLVAGAKPLVPLLALARQNPDVLQSVRNWAKAKLASNTAILAAFAQSLRDGAQIYPQLTGQLQHAVASAQDKLDIARTAFSIDPLCILGSLNKTIQTQIFQKLHVHDMTAAVAAIRQSTNASILNLDGQGSVQIDGVAVGLSIDAAITRVVQSSTPTFDDLAVQRYQALLNRLVASNPNVLSAVIDRLQPQDLENLIGTKLQAGTMAASDVFDGIVAQSDAARSTAESYLQNVEAGYLNVQKTDLVKPEDVSAFGKVAGPTGGIETNQQGPDALKLALAGPLGAAFPQAQVAYMAGQWVAGNVDIMSHIDQVNDISSKLQQDTVDEITLDDEIDKAKESEDLANQDKRIADARFSQAASDVHDYQAQLDSLAQDAETLRSRIVSQQRVGLIYVLSENLSYDFASVNRALRQWLGYGDGSTDIVRQLITQDPQAWRLALDPQIRLFDLLADEPTKQRANLDELKGAWDNLKTFVDILCRTKGCSKENPGIGSIGRYGPLHLQDLLKPDELSSFKSWQKSQSSDPFVFHLRISLPQVQSANTATSLNALRVVRIAATTTDAQSNKSIAQITFYHSGIAEIPTHDGTFLETLQQASYPPLQSVEQLDVNLDNLRTRWSQPGGGNLDNFEGYGLLSDWTISVAPSAANRNATDLAVEFAYEYEPGPPHPLGQWTAYLSPPGGVPIALTAQDLSFLNSHEAVMNNLARWTSASGWVVGAVDQNGIEQRTKPRPTADKLAHWSTGP